MAVDGPRAGAWVAPAPPMPKPSTRPLVVPSRATTYIRPLWTVGVVNLLPVPIGQLPRSVSTPPVGLASYARSSAFCCWPGFTGQYVTQTSAEPDDVPSDVTIAELDP